MALCPLLLGILTMATPADPPSRAEAAEAQAQERPLHTLGTRAAAAGGASL